MGDGEHVALAKAGHFDFPGVCTGRGVDILRNEEPSAVMVCQEGPMSRADLHRAIADDVFRFLAEFTAR